MEWKIDTGAVGECAAKDLRGVLEAAREHHLTTQANLAGAQIMATLPKKDPTEEAIVATAARATLAKQGHAMKQIDLAEQIAIGIDVACKMAEAFGGTVTATVAGHHNPRHASGCAQRLSVAVDQVLAG